MKQSILVFSVNKLFVKKYYSVDVFVKFLEKQMRRRFGKFYMQTVFPVRTSIGDHV